MNGARQALTSAELQREFGYSIDSPMKMHRNEGILTRLDSITFIHMYPYYLLINRYLREE